MTPAKKTTTTTADMGEKKKEYKYQQEISQMVRTQTRRQGPVLPKLILAVYRRCLSLVRYKNHSRRQ
jgi:hypothetical protein